MWISIRKYIELIEELKEKERNIQTKGTRIGLLEHALETKEKECRELKQRVLRACSIYKVTISLLNLTTHTYTITALSTKDAREMAIALFLRENTDCTKDDIACTYVNEIRGGV